MKKIGKNCKYNYDATILSWKRKVYRCSHPDHKHHQCGLNSECKGFFKDFESNEDK